ncbi:OmpA family protein [Belliella kenyensis]|uniref:OmpA family protein n=1 Tax=Belliella kenyensis TaxID=1472724 RepID=A0ABV8EKM9_9BACT|nr:OmpA family protein [Belliella kenyensis]MCH7400230.1 OmpA family protein [Belliella kenyensis]MDN3604753.1 OmpA family protein [Belliella kenyensis]
MNNFLKASGIFLLAFSFATQSVAQEVVPLKVLNTPYDEQHPVVSPNGELFYSVGFHPDNLGGNTDLGDIWMAKQSASGDWLAPVHVRSLSTNGNDVVVGFPDALTAYVYHSGDGVKIKQGIHQYARFGSEWNYVRMLSMGNFRNQSSHFSGRLSKDNKAIIMALNSYGSYGNEDLYVSEMIREGLWSSPTNLGSDVNSFGQEMTPSISSDLSTIYFSSNSNTAGRGRDVYMAKRKGEGWDQWSKPIPQSQVNTEGAELSYLVFDLENERAIFTSTKNSEGFGDLMLVAHLINEEDESKEENTISETFQTVQDSNVVTQPDTLTRNAMDTSVVNEREAIEELKSEVSQIADAVVSIETPESPDSVNFDSEKSHVQITVKDASTLDEISYNLTTTNRQGVKSTLEDAEALENMMNTGQLVSFTISSQGYIPATLSAGVLNEDKLEVLLTPVRSGALIVLENIQFNRGTADFADAQSINQLDELVDFMKANPNVTVRLEGHTDNAGDPQLNKELSMQRASKIRAYLTLKGVEFESVRIAGWGGARPIADNGTEEGREKNRRVEFIIDRIK